MISEWTSDEQAAFQAVRDNFASKKGAIQLSFSKSVADVFGAKPKAAMLYEGDFVAGEITALHQAKVAADARFFNFRSINGSRRASSPAVTKPSCSRIRRRPRH